MSDFLTGQLVDLSLALSPPGSVLPIGGTPTWSVDNPELATITPSADGSSATLLGLAAGTVNVTFTDGFTTSIAVAFAAPVVVATGATIVVALDPASPAT